MSTLSPIEVVICLIPVVFVVVIAIIVINAVRAKPGKKMEANLQAIAQKDPQVSNSIGDVSRINSSTESLVKSQNGLATTSLVLSILAIVVYMLFEPVWANCMGPLAMIIGAISLLQIRHQGGKGKGTAITGIAVGTLPFIITIVTILLSTVGTVLEHNQSNENHSSLTACGRFADNPVAEQYAEPPLNIDISKQYHANVKLAKGGAFVIQLYPDKAPKTVNSFVFLACKGYFDGVTFHRVLEGFMAQGGDPTGTGTGGPGYAFEYEGSDLIFNKPGVVAMANTGPATPTNGSQFFITFAPTPQLDGGYTIFGQVIEGMDVVNGITRRDPQQNPTFEGDVIETVTITEE